MSHLTLLPLAPVPRAFGTVDKKAEDLSREEETTHLAGLVHTVVGRTPHCTPHYNDAGTIMV